MVSSDLLCPNPLNKDYWGHSVAKVPLASDSTQSQINPLLILNQRQSRQPTKNLMPASLALLSIRKDQLRPQKGRPPPLCSALPHCMESIILTLSAYRFTHGCLWLIRLSQYHYSKKHAKVRQHLTYYN